MLTSAAAFERLWPTFRGSREALKWNRRDLPTVDRLVDLCRQHRVAVQAGGHLGIFAKRLAASFEAVYTFEAAADLFVLMTQNAPEPNIHRYQAALGYHRQMVGTARVRRDGKPHAHEGVTHIAGAGPIPTLQVDDLRLSACDLLLLDIEGWELYALMGADATLRVHRPVVCVEVNRNLTYLGLEPADVRRYLDDRGYQRALRLEADEIYLPREWAS